MNSSQLTERQCIEYDDKQINNINCQKGILQLEIQMSENNGTNTIYENQEKVGKQLYQLFKNREVINIMVTAMMQSGKTGTMLSFISQYVRRENIPIDNIVILTGLSDVEWHNDTTERMPNSLRSRIYHRNMIKKVIKLLKGMKDIVIIIDELQIAGQAKQTISKLFNALGFYDLNNLLENDIKIVQFSATPDGHLEDLLKWENHCRTIKMEPGDGYTGVKDFMEQGRVFQCKELKVKDYVSELVDIVKKFNGNRYHLIRVPDKGKGQDIVIDNFKEVFGHENFVYNTDYLNDKSDFNEVLSVEPDKHIFVFYCQKARCAKTFNVKKYIGISYERFAKKFNDSTILQSSIGRLCGYNDNGDSICFTNISSCENYIKFWENDLNYHGVEWNTTTTKYDKSEKITKSRDKSFNHAKHVNGLDVFEDVTRVYQPKMLYQKLDGKLKTLIKWWNTTFPDRSKFNQNNRKRDSNGKYLFDMRIVPESEVEEAIRTDRLLKYISRQGTNQRDSRNIVPYYTDEDEVKWIVVYSE